MTKNWKIFVLTILTLAAALIIHSVFLDQKAQRMLNAVDLGDHRELRWVPSIVLNGPRFEKDGFEYMVFSNENNRDRKTMEERIPWIWPISWTTENTDVLTLGERLGIKIDVEAIMAESMGGIDCSAWFCFMPGYEGSSSVKQEYYLGYYDSFADEVFICHGYVMFP